MDKHDVIVKCVEELKRSQFKATAIKIELEAQLNRDNSGCGDCYEGYTSCYDCDEGYITCDSCEEGHVECSNCDGSGTVANGRRNVACEECEGNGEVRCEYECDDGYFRCDECEGGNIACDNCDGGSGNWGNDRVCQDWILEKLQPLGVSQFDSDAGRWRVKGPLKYARFYNDGSVDSELTFTLALDNPENVMMLPKFVETFAALANEMNGTFDTQGAGMHMALLSNELCIYPANTTREQQRCYINFKKSMTLLLPALFFLGSGDDKSRAMRYRRPIIGSDFNNDGGKYCAVSFRQGALEYRVFDTCYDNPEAILDNLVVIRNCMRYWRKTYIAPGVHKIANNVEFGNDLDNTLKRFYQTVEHIDLLNKGLTRLKPSYYTVKQLKKQRNFDVSKFQIKNKVKQIEKEAQIEYKEYESRFAWNVVVRRNRYMADLAERRVHSEHIDSDEDRMAVMADMEQNTEQHIAEFARSKQSLEQYINQKIEEYRNRRVGEFPLSI